MLASALLFNSKAIALAKPFFEALCSAVKPKESASFGSVPLARRRATPARSPRPAKRSSAEVSHLKLTGAVTTA